jgi:hypothetical protein
MLVTDLHLAQRLRIEGAIILLPVYTLMTWTSKTSLNTEKWLQEDANL